MTKTISREHILGDLPEIATIRSESLREKVVDAWVFALERSSFDRVIDIPGEGSPDVFTLHEGKQDAHLRGVTRMALKIVEEFEDNFFGVQVDRDIIIAGALCHDIGKTWEFDPVNQKRWKNNADRYGDPSFRHSTYGTHVCLSVGLPEEIAHIAMGHSLEGVHLGLSTECYIIRQADNLWWHTAAALGLCRPDTVDFAGPTLRVRQLKSDRSDTSVPDTEPDKAAL
uniref:HD domain-containing protein n=1 Tax=Pararhizobium sp. IMCC3301 TaxID=3067904 RepID=UPI0027412590|nr:HD domain-containing protein [Pararhizobium sp. IMCC3301]